MQFVNVGTMMKYVLILFSNQNMPFHRINEESPCVSYLDVCCGSEEVRQTPILPPTTPRPNPNTGGVNSSGGGTSPGSGTKPGGTTGNTINSGSGLRGCGQRNPDGVGFRIKGNADNEAAFGEFPWMVAILR